GGDVAGHVQAHFVDQAQRPHGHAEVEHAFVDVFHARAVLEEEAGLDQIRHEDAVDQEPGAVLDHDRQFSDLLDELHRSSDDGRSGLTTDDDLDQLHAVDGVEEVNADDSFGAASAGGDLADGKRGSVGGEDGVGSGQFVQAREELSLEIHSFDGGLDHKIGEG